MKNFDEIKLKNDLRMEQIQLKYRNTNLDSFKNSQLNVEKSGLQPFEKKQTATLVETQQNRIQPNMQRIDIDVHEQAIRCLQKTQILEEKINFLMQKDVLTARIDSDDSKLLSQLVAQVQKQQQIIELQANSITELQRIIDTKTGETQQMVQNMFNQFCQIVSDVDEKFKTNGNNMLEAFKLMDERQRQLMIFIPKK